jgi:polyamine oxidase
MVHLPFKFHSFVALSFGLTFLTLSVDAVATPHDRRNATSPKVLILGGGMAGVIAARTLHQAGIVNFVIVEARDELGGRMQTQSFGGKIIEQGPNWIQGTQVGNGPANPMLVLAEKHNLTRQFNDWFGSVSEYYLSLCYIWL